MQTERFQALGFQDLGSCTVSPTSCPKRPEVCVVGRLLVSVSGSVAERSQGNPVHREIVWL